MLKEYERFLTKKGTVKTQYIPYYLKWVSDCYVYLNEPMSKRLGSEQKNQFLSHMSKQHEDWQVKQADTALRLYDFFLSKNIIPTIGEIPIHKETWGVLEEKMRDALRLRHRSLSTENLPPIFWKPDMISEPSRNCSAVQTSRRP